MQMAPLQNVTNCRVVKRRVYIMKCFEGGSERRLTAAASIARMKIEFGVKTDKQLADILGVSHVTISAWRKRDSVPIDRLIYAAGKLLKNVEIFIYEYGSNTKISGQTDNEEAYAVALTFFEEARRYGSLLDDWSESFRWGRVFPKLVEYYETEISTISYAEDAEWKDSAKKIISAIKDMDWKEMQAIVRSLDEPV